MVQPLYNAPGGRSRLVYARLLLGLSGALAVAAAAAAPPAPVTTYSLQPDGTPIPVRLTGDGHAPRVETETGHTIVRDEGGNWVYALADANQPTGMGGALATAVTPSEFVVGWDDAAADGIPRHIHVPVPDGAAADPYTSALAVGVQAGQTLGNPIRPFAGTVPLLVILGYYDDGLAPEGCAACGTTSASHVADFVFGEGGQTHNVRDYYAAASNGKVSLVPAREAYGLNDDGMLGWLRLGATTPEAATTTLSLDKSNRVAADAIAAAMPYVDFTAYDLDGNQVVDARELAIVIVLAGYESAYGADQYGRLLADTPNTPRIWAHSMYFRPSVTGVPAPVQTVGARTVTINSTDRGHAYTIIGERHGDHAATMGLLTHELGHLIFGLPDLYDVSGASAGVGVWSLMGYGTWGYTAHDAWPGETPALPEAWTRTSLGWIAPIAGGTEGALETLSADRPNATVIRITTSNPNEYFLIENRQNGGYDAGLRGLLGADFGGIAVWHIDDTVGLTGYNNDNADPQHKRVDLVAAWGDEQLDRAIGYGHPTNLFYDGNSVRLDGTTNPNTNLYSGAASGFGIRAVSYSAPAMTVVVGVSPVSAPASGGGGTMDLPGLIVVALLLWHRRFISPKRRRPTRY